MQTHFNYFRSTIMLVVIAGMCMDSAQADLQRFVSHGGIEFPLVIANVRSNHAISGSLGSGSLGSESLGSESLGIDTLFDGSSFGASVLDFGAFDLGILAGSNGLAGRFGDVLLPAIQNAESDGGFVHGIDGWVANALANQDQGTPDDYARYGAQGDALVDLPNELFDVGRNGASADAGDLRFSPPTGNPAQNAAPGGGIQPFDSLNIGDQFEQTDSTGHNPPHFPHMPVPGAASLGLIGLAVISRRRVGS